MQVLYQLSYGPKDALGPVESDRRRVEAYTANRPNQPPITSVAIQRPACPAPAPDRRVTQSVHRRGLQPPIER